MRLASPTPRALLPACCTPAAVAALVPPDVQAAIDALLRRLQATGSAFSHGASGYSGTAAKPQLLPRLDVRRGHGAVPSAAPFIALVATTGP